MGGPCSLMVSLTTTSIVQRNEVWIAQLVMSPAHHRRSLKSTLKALRGHPCRLSKELPKEFCLGKVTLAMTFMVASGTRDEKGQRGSIK